MADDIQITARKSRHLPTSLADAVENARILSGPAMEADGSGGLNEPNTIEEAFERGTILSGGDHAPRIVGSPKAQQPPPLSVVYPSAFQGLPVPLRRWLWENWIADRVVTLLTGDGGT